MQRLNAKQSRRPSSLSTRVDAVVQCGELEAILTGRTYEEVVKIPDRVASIRDMLE